MENFWFNSAPATSTQTPELTATLLCLQDSTKDLGKNTAPDENSKSNSKGGDVEDDDAALSVSVHPYPVPPFSRFPERIWMVDVTQPLKLAKVWTLDI